MSLEELTKERLMQLLIETVHAMVMYPNHKTYTHELMLQEKTDLKPEELAVRLNMTVGEALVILRELEEKKSSS
jgi:hypothetical protein